jgi:hypothetical protein
MAPAPVVVDEADVVPCPVLVFVLGTPVDVVWVWELDVSLVVSSPQPAQTRKPAIAEPRSALRRIADMWMTAPKALSL